MENHGKPWKMKKKIKAWKSFTFCYEIKEFFKKGHVNEMNRALGHFVHI